MHSFPDSEAYGHFLIELRASREKSGLTQIELAERLGVHQTLVSKAERGTRRVDVVELRQWLSALGDTSQAFIKRFEQRLDRHSRLSTARKRSVE